MKEERKGTREASKRAARAQRVPEVNSRDSSNGLHREHHTSRQETPHAPSARRVGPLEDGQSGELEQRWKSERGRVDEDGKQRGSVNRSERKTGGARKHDGWLRQGSRTTWCRRLVHIRLAAGAMFSQEFDW